MDIVKSIKGKMKGDDPYSALCLSQDERKDARELLDSFPFGGDATTPNERLL
jgi:hypothetical protein